MAGFFSLGSSSSASGRETATTTPQQDQNQPTNTENNNNININNPNWAANPSHPGLLLYRNEEIYQKSFEIWQQYVQVHHHPKLLHPPQDHPHPFLHHTLYLGGGGGDPMAGPSSGGGARPSSSGPRVMMRGGGGGGGGINCQDCGNQAKKDCAHMRCRTCCKSRGFDCPTHVKSTWVPAAKRRERQQQQILSLQQQQQSQQLDIGLREKRQRESRSLANVTTDTTTNNPLPSRMGASSSGLEVGQHFPAEVSSPATFRCVRVHSVDDADEQLAYQTAVSIGGHLFKGILYDQGPDTHYPPAAGEISPGGEPSGAATLHHHNLLTSAAENPGGSGAAECLDPNAIYPPPMSTFLAGTQFFPPPRS